MTTLDIGILPGTRTDALKLEGYKQSVASLLLSTFAINLLSLALPVMTLQVYDRILPNEGTGTLPILIAGVCIAVICEFMLRLCRSYVIGRSGAAFEHRMACLAMSKVINADFSKMGHYGIGEHLHRMGSVAKLKDFYNGYALSVAADLTFIPVYFLLIYYIASPLVIVPVIVMAAFIVMSLICGKNLRNRLKERELADDKRFNFLIESLEGVHTVKAFALEKFFERRYEALEEDSTRSNYRVTQETANTFNNGAVFSHIMVASVITIGAYCVLHGLVTTGGLIATLLLSGRIMQPLQRALALWARYQDYMIARGHIEEIMMTPQQKYNAQLGFIEPTSNGEVQIRDISFRYKEEENYILKNLSLELGRGETILIHGEHGCGTTTLLSLIAGIYSPNQGEIVLDGFPMTNYHSAELTKHVAYIRTNPVIFRGSIRDNITGFGHISEIKAREVASMLQVDTDVAKLPGGFDTFLNGDSTDMISPGLKQRIAMVRALAPKPRLVLFDHADRSLDKEGYSMIYSFLARLKGKASIILVSDDNNIQNLAQRSYELRAGELFETAPKSRSGNIHPYKELRL